MPNSLPAFKRSADVLPPQYGICCDGTSMQRFISALFLNAIPFFRQGSGDVPGPLPVCIFFGRKEQRSTI